MELPVWPSSLESRPVIGAVSVDNPYPDVAVTEFEDGPPRMRRQSFTGIRKLSYQLRLDSKSELAAFDDFATVTLGNGVSHFTMPVYLPGRGCVTRRCYLEGGRWTATPLGGGGFLVSFTLCVFPS